MPKKIPVYRGGAKPGTVFRSPLHGAMMRVLRQEPELDKSAIERRMRKLLVENESRFMEMLHEHEKAHQARKMKTGGAPTGPVMEREKEEEEEEVMERGEELIERLLKEYGV